MQEIGSFKTLKADIDLVDETFDVSQSESYHLSIQTEPDGLSFCICNTSLNKYIVLRSYRFPDADFNKLANECSFIFENDELLGLKYKSSSHLWVSSCCTLVPNYLFDAADAETCLEFNHGKMTGEQTQHHYIKPLNLNNIFSCPETLTELLRKYQPAISLFHQTAPFIETVIATPSLQHSSGIAVFYYSNYLDIVVVENQRLLFYNTFKIVAPEDSVYYLAGVSNLFNINLLTTKLLYVGDLNLIPPEVAILRNYVEDIVECLPSNAFTYSYHIPATFRKKFINLFNLYGCES